MAFSVTAPGSPLIRSKAIFNAEIFKKWIVKVL